MTKAVKSTIISLAAVAALALAACSEPTFDPAKLMEGDLVFVKMTGDDDAAEMSFLLPDKPYNHVAMLSWDGKNKRFEALESWKTVRLTKLDDWLKRFKGEKIIVKRFKYAQPEQIRSALGICFNFLQLPYEREMRWDSDWAFYNSELILKCLERAQVINKVELKPMASYIAGRENPHYLTRLVPDDDGVAFADVLFNEPNLATVFEGKYK